jgi:hypothetical protein
VTALTVRHMRTGRVQPGLDPTSPTGKGMVATVACGLTLPVRSTTADRAKVACPACVTAYDAIVHELAGTTWTHYGTTFYCTCGNYEDGLNAAKEHRAHVEEMNAA